MIIGVDIRHLGGEAQSGVGQYTLELLRALTSSPQHQWILFSSGSRKAKINIKKHLGDLLDLPNIHHTHRHIPNKLLNLSILLFGHPTLASLAGVPAHLFWCPNLNFIALPKHTPTVVTFHDLSFRLFPHHLTWKGRLWHRLIRPKHLARHATHLIVPSKTTQEDLVHLFGVESHRITTVAHGVSDAFSPEKLPQDHGVRSRHNLPRSYVLHMGTQEPRKNIPLLIEAFVLARSRSELMRRLETELVLAGNTLASFTSRTFVRSLGYVPSVDRPALYRQAITLAFPSIYEGFGMPILEAFASGTPVITSHTSAMAEVGNDAVILINPFDVEGLARAIQELVEDSELRELLKTRGLTEKESYTWQRSAELTLAVFEREREGEWEMGREECRT